MRRAPLPARSSRGFTLLEMSVVLFIMAILAGLCIHNFSSLNQEDVIRKPAVELQRMTMEAVRRVAASAEAEVIAFDPRGFSIQYRRAADGLEASGKRKKWQRRVTVPEGMNVVLKRFGAASFQPATGQRVLFLPGSLCEPVTARFELGASWLQIRLDPLTGGVAEEEMYIAPRP